MYKLLYNKTAHKNGFVPTKNSLASIVNKKYTITGTTTSLVNVKVLLPDGTTATLTKPASATTVALTKTWLEQAIRDLGWWVTTNDVGDNTYTSLQVNSGTIVFIGEMVVTFGNYGASDVAATVASTPKVFSRYEIAFTAANNPTVNINGTAYTTTYTAGVVPGTLKTAIDTGIAAAIPSIVLSTAVIYDAELSKHIITFSALQNTEIVFNGVVVPFKNAYADIV